MTAETRIPLIFDYDELAGWMIDNLCDIDAETFQTAAVRLGRNYGPSLLADMWHEDILSDKTLSEVIGVVWSAAEFPMNNLDPDTWLHMFETAGYTIDGKPSERPVEPLKLYRGAVYEKRAGWSWTDDLETAERFASDLLGRQASHVWTATIAAKNLLAKINDREESEYVVNPAGLTITQK